MALQLQQLKGDLALLRARALVGEGSLDEAQAQVGRALVAQPKNDEALALRKELRQRSRRGARR